MDVKRKVKKITSQLKNSSKMQLQQAKDLEKAFKLAGKYMK